MPVYRADVHICGTAYIRAANKREAQRLLRRLKMTALHVENAKDEPSEVSISGLTFDSPSLPQISLSPAMTIHGKWPGELLEDVEPS